ncbi:MAG: hypothetical protein RIR89_1048 [Actinomycetota bacterium]
MRFYVDETFQLPEQDRDRKPFYALAAIGIPYEEEEPIRQFLKAIGHGEPIHGTELLRSDSGHKELLEISKRISHHCIELVTSCPVAKNDRNGEKAREKLIKALSRHIIQHYPQTKQILFEQRLSGYTSEEDARTFKEVEKELKASGIDLAQAYKTSEPLLWAADLLASSYRQMMTRAVDRYFDAWQAEVVIP